MRSDIKRRVFVSLPTPESIDSRPQVLRAEFVKRIRDMGYEPEIFFESGIAAGMAWSMENVREIIRRCVGAAFLAMPRWTLATEGGEIRFTSEYIHYEGGVAHSFRLPFIVIAELGIEQRGMLWTGAGHPILFMPADADKEWFGSDAFSHRFGLWKQALDETRDVFLGYCSKAKATADAIQLYLTKTLGLRVMDWAMDFTSGGTIIEQIEDAAAAVSSYLQRMILWKARRTKRHHETM